MKTEAQWPGDLASNPTACSTSLETSFLQVSDEGLGTSAGILNLRSFQAQGCGRGSTAL